MRHGFLLLQLVAGQGRAVCRSGVALTIEDGQGVGCIEISQRQDSIAIIQCAAQRRQVGRR